MYLVKLITSCGVYCEKRFVFKWRAQAFRDSVLLRCREIDMERVCNVGDRLALVVPILFLSYLLVCCLPLVAHADEVESGNSESSVTSSEVLENSEGSENPQEGASSESVDPSQATQEGGETPSQVTLADVNTKLDAVIACVDQLEAKADTSNGYQLQISTNLTSLKQAKDDEADLSEVVNSQVFGDFFFVMLVDTALLVLVLGALAFLAFKPRM